MNIAQQARSLDPLKTFPYRVEWRADLTCGWVLLTGCDSHSEALEEMALRHGQYGGQTRVVSQHVVEARGLGANA